MTTKVSVIIPCYNYGKYITEAVDSVLNSNYENLEIIIIDDGSDDSETVAILDNFSRPKTKIIRQTNQGVIAARNNGIKEAQGEYILPLDADDYINPAFIEKAVEILDNNHDIGIVYSNYTYVDDIFSEATLPDWDSKSILYGNLCTNTSFFRKKDWEKVGGYKSQMSAGYEDWEFWISLAEIGVKGYKIKESLFYYRLHGNSRNTIAVKNDFENFKQIMKLHSDFYIDNIQYIIFPILLKIMKEIPLNIKARCLSILLKNIFFSKRTFIHIASVVKCMWKKVFHE